MGATFTEGKIQDIVQSVVDSDILCRNNMKLEVLMSQGGYYIGTRTPEGYPYCRASDYYRNPSFLKEQLESGAWVERSSMEVEVCNNGEGCKKPVEYIPSIPEASPEPPTTFSEGTLVDIDFSKIMES